MIKAKFFWNAEDSALRLRVEGHAGMGDVGEDVVCAAVSCLVQTLADKVQEAMRRGFAMGRVQREAGNRWIIEANHVNDDEAWDALTSWFDFAESGLAAVAARYPEAVELESVSDTGEAMANGWNLQIFAEGGGDGGAAGAAADGDGAGPAPSPTEGPKDARAEVEAMLEEDGEEGDPDQDADEEEPDEDDKPDPEQRQKAFREMIRGEYRAEFQQSIQQAVGATLQQLMGENTQLGNLLDTLAHKYNTQPGDLGALMAAVQQGEKGDEYYEDLALKKGVSVRLAKEMDTMETELAQLRNERQQRVQQAEIRRIHVQWDAEAQRLHEMDPEFDIKEALQNPTFAAVLKSGVPMEAAYQAAYFDRILERSTQNTAQKVEQGVTERIRQRGSRPAENGTNPGGAATLKTDVSKLTKAQCEELERQVRMGKIIKL